MEMLVLLECPGAAAVGVVVLVGNCHSFSSERNAGLHSQVARSDSVGSTNGLQWARPHTKVPKKEKKNTTKIFLKKNSIIHNTFTDLFFLFKYFSFGRVGTQVRRSYH